MKAIVLAAGLGTRLRPWSDIVPKPLFPVLGIPVIQWALAAVRQAGVVDVVVNLHHLPGAITGFLGDGRRFGVNVRYSSEPTILGTGGALVAAAGLLDGEGPFIVHNGDIFNDWNLSALAGAAAPALCVTDGPGLPAGDRRVELTGDGRVAGLRGLPGIGNGRRVVYGGVALVDMGVVERLRAGMPGIADGLVDEACLVGDALIPMLTDGCVVNAVEFDSRWYCDIGTPASYLELNARALRHAAVLLGARGFPCPGGGASGVMVDDGAVVGRKVTFVDPVMVCRGAVIGDGAVVGPDVVVSGVVEPGCRLAGAVVMAGARVGGDATGIFASPGA